VPGAVLVYTAYDQLKWESFRGQQLAAEALAGRIDRGLAELAEREDARPPSDYRFLVPAGEGAGQAERPSPLSAFPPGGEIPGLLGWFQVGEDGAFGTPLVPGPGVRPEAFGLGPDELASREAQARTIRSVLAGGRLAGARRAEPDAQIAAQAQALAPAPAPAPTQAAAPALAPAPGWATAEPERSPPPLAAQGSRAGSGALSRAKDESEGEERVLLSQAAIERLASGEGSAAGGGSAGSLARVEELALDSKLAERGLGKSAERQAQRRQPAPAKGGRAAQTRGTDLGLADRGGRGGAEADGTGSVLLFGGEREPLRLGRLASGHFVLFRAARQGGERVIQGALIEEGPFLAGLLGGPYAQSDLADNAELTAAYRGGLLTSFRAGAEGPEPRGYSASARALTGELLYRARLGEPFGGLELIFSVRRLPPPPGAAAIGLLAGALALVLVGGTWLMERLGSRQIALALQQQAFVSAVSHELKTPLTSIRLYAEMLAAGFADEGRRPLYYRYIQEESERLSRLIANVLTLSRIGRGTLKVDPRPVAVAELMESLRERIAVPAERAGFRLRLDCAGPGLVMADPDALLQVLLNLVDNALKFAADGEPKEIEIGCERLDPAPGPAGWRFRVRDHGPGIPRAERRRVFRLFYRGADAARGAVGGTGIGLALVEGLVLAMGGRVEVTAREPGAELAVELPAVRP
jgi:signal transduction histidine kinase